MIFPLKRTFGSGLAVGMADENVGSTGLAILQSRALASRTGIADVVGTRGTA
jgi:hypothetical protein